MRVLRCLALGPLLLGGCSKAQQASTSLPPTASARAVSSAATSLSPLGPADFPVPAEARKKTPEGINAFTNYYIQLINRSSLSLDSTSLLDLSRDCETCKELADGYDAMKASGQRFEGGAITVTGTGSAVNNGYIGETSFVLDEEPTFVKDASGADVVGRARPATRYTGGVQLMWDDQRSTWLMSRFDVDPL